MKQIIVGDNEAGQRFDKLLLKILSSAGKSFIYKMLRKKNIVLNGKKATGNELLKLGDEVKIFLSDETYEKFSKEEKYDEKSLNINKKENLDIIYEDENVIFINKKEGMLSQKDTKESVSVVEYLIDYMLTANKITKEQLKSFKPSVCNRLDRNTTGVIVAGKSLIGLQKMSEYIKNKTVDKYYLAIVKGVVKEKKLVTARLIKNNETNKVTIVNLDEISDSSKTNKKSLNESNEISKNNKKNADVQGDYIKTEYEPIRTNGKYTLLKVKLITGKTHQIRAHLASIGFPIIGDYKYGDKKENDFLKKRYGIEHQLLHSYQMVFPKLEEDILGMSEKVITAKVPKKFDKILSDKKMD